MQAAFQESTDNAVSKTVNFSNDATKEDVAEAYLLSYKLGCKGVTVYRDGSRDVQVLTRGSGKSEEKAQPEEVSATALEVSRNVSAKPKDRGEVAFGVTRKVKTGCGNLYVIINEDEEGNPFEIFTQIGKAGGCVASQCEAMGRMTSLALRSGIGAEEIVKQMRGISCHLPVGYGSDKVLSCSDAMGKALEWYLRFRASRGQTATLASGLADSATGVRSDMAAIQEAVHDNEGLSLPLLMTSLNAALVPTAAALWSMPMAVSSAGVAATPSAADINAII